MKDTEQTILKGAVSDDKLLVGNENMKENMRDWR